MSTAQVEPNAIATTEDFEFEALKMAVNYRRTITEAFAPYLKGNVIEIGAGIGQMTAEFLELSGITRLLPVEPDPLFCLKYAQNLPGHELIQGIIKDVPSTVGWNGIVSINVLEHIEADGEELRQYREKLASQNGYVCILVPARPEIYAPIDKDFGHFRRYTRSGLQTCLEDAGFEIVKLDYFNLTGYFAWFWSFKLLGGRHFRKEQVQLFDKHIFPVTQWIEKKLPALPFGQSLLAVGRA